MPAGSLAYVFGHGQFIQAARAIVADAHLDDRAKMRAVWRKGEPPAIGNAQRVGCNLEVGRCDFPPALPAPVKQPTTAAPLTASARQVVERVGGVRTENG